jgi:hypothetical protein
MHAIVSRTETVTFSASARREWNVDPPTCEYIYEWDKTLRETGSLISHAGKHPTQHVTEENVDRVRESFSRSPRKSIRKPRRTKSPSFDRSRHCSQTSPFACLQTSTPASH